MDRINKSKVDPLSMYTTPQIILILKREEKEAPEKEPDEEEQQYRERLIEVCVCVCVCVCVMIIRNFMCLAHSILQLMPPNSKNVITSSLNHDIV